MCRCALSPALVFHDVVSAAFARVADCLKGVTANGAEARTAAASAHIHRVSCVSKVKPSSVLAQWSNVTRSGKSKASGCQRLWICLESHGWNTMLEAYKRGEHATQAVSGCDDVRVGVQLGDLFKQLQCRCVVSVWLDKFIFDAGLITSISARLTITHFAPKIRTALTTAARAHQVVVLLVMARSTVSFKHGYSRALDSQDNGRVGVVAKHVTSNATVIPTEWNRGIVLIVDIEPFWVISPGFIRIFGHVCEIDYSFLVFNVWSWDVFGNPDWGHWNLSIVHPSGRSLDLDTSCLYGKRSVLTRFACYGYAIRGDVQPTRPWTWLASTMMEDVSQSNSIRTLGTGLAMFDLWRITEWFDASERRQSSSYTRDLREYTEYEICIGFTTSHFVEACQRKKEDACVCIDDGC
jgi:hypothetical protein